MTNFGTLAILGLPGIPERQLRFLLALETVTARDGGWREVGTDVLSTQARVSVKTACKARAELAKASLIEYRRGTGPGHPGRYRLLVDVSKPPKNAARVKPGTGAARVNPGTGAATVNPGKQAPVSLVNEPEKPTPPDAVTSANADISLEPLSLEASAARARGRDAAGLDLHMIIRGIGADEHETRLIAAELENDPGINDPAAWLLKIIGDGDERAFLHRMRRRLATQNTAVGEPLVTRWPDWCGQCDDTRHIEQPDGTVARCPRCHPLARQQP